MHKAIKMRIAAALVLPSLVFASSQSHANVITENSDAGNDIATAFIVPGGTTEINGTLGPPTAWGPDVDLYRFGVSTTGTFSVQANEVTDALDMNLMLFNALGQGLAGDDDDSSDGVPIVPLGTGLDSLLTLSLTAGDYFVAVGDNNIAAYATVSDFIAGNPDFIDNDWGILDSPTTETLGLVGAEGGPTRTRDEGDYILYFSAPTAQTVPEPSTIAMFGIGAVGLFGYSRRRRQTSAA